MMAEVRHLPYTRVLDQAQYWATLDEVRGLCATVRSRGGKVSGLLDEKYLKTAHPGRVHAVMQKRTPIFPPLPADAVPDADGFIPAGEPVDYHYFWEIRLWDDKEGRSYGCPIEVESEDLETLERLPAPEYHELVAHMNRGVLTE